jgi:YD repeat-containing protein
MKTVFSMKTILSIITFFLIVVQAWGQPAFELKEKERIASNKVKSQTQWGHDYVSGKPKTAGYKTTHTLYDRNGNVLQVINYKSNGDVSSVLQYQYDTQGRRTEYVRFKGNKEEMTYSQFTAYDTKGNKISEWGFDGVSNYSNGFTLDGQGRTSEIKYHTDKILTEKREFKYGNQETTVHVTRPDGAITSRIQIKYTESGQVIEEARYLPDNTLVSKVSYKYDKNGNVLEESKYQYGRFQHRTRNIYDNSSNILEILKEDSAGESVVTNQYIYDNKGNLIEEKWYKENSNEYSSKKYDYDAKNLLKEMDCYFASYKFSILYKYVYEFY